MVELLVVCSVIIALMAIGFPVLFKAKADAGKTGTINLVEGVAAAIATYGTRSWSWTESGSRRSGLLWDLNGDGVIDGNPGAGESLPSAIVASGYTGFLDMAQPPVPPQFVNASRQVVDAWQQPLRISYPKPTASMTEEQVRREMLRYGTTGFLVWSLGPDGQPDTADDIRHGDQPNDD